MISRAGSLTNLQPAMVAGICVGTVVQVSERLEGEHA